MFFKAHNSKRLQRKFYIFATSVFDVAYWLSLSPCSLTALHQGTEGSPLVIKGGRGAVISAFSGDRALMWDQKVVDIRHSWVTLEVSDRYSPFEHRNNTRFNHTPNCRSPEEEFVSGLC